MKKFSVTCLMICAFSYNTFAYFVLNPLYGLENSDLIVVGTLQSVSEYTEDGMDYGEGKIVVERVLFGNVKTQYGSELKPNDIIQLKWQNSSNIICPRVEHKPSENKKEIWLLNIAENGIVRTYYPAGSISLNAVGEVTKFLSKRYKAAGTLKTVVIQNTNERARQTDMNDSTIEFTADNFQPRKYSLFNALITLLISLGLYWILYRKRWQD